MQTSQDKEILETYKIDKEKAFRNLLKYYNERLYYHIRSIVIDHEDANDVLQESLIKIWKALNNFRGDSALYTWLYRIATNESLNYLKAQKKKQLQALNSENEFLLSKLRVDEYFSGDEIQLKLQKAILTLPNQQRLVFNMKYFKSMKYTQIAEILELSEGTLKTHYHLAVKKIKEYLKQND